MKKADLDDSDLDFRELLKSASPSEIEAACMYEYMRESQILRDALNAPTENARREKSGELASPFLLSLTPEQLVRLMLALQAAGFPEPWKRLTKDFQRPLVSLLVKSRNGTMRGDKALYPPVVIENASVEFDRYGETADQYYHWRLKPTEPRLLEKYERSARDWFFGFIRIDQRYNETEAIEAFKEEFRKRWPKTKGGNRERWGAKLKSLAVMRIWKRIPGKGYLLLYKRLGLVAGFCGYKGCVKEAAAYKERCKEGRGDEPMSEAAKVEMSSARAEALTFFQSLFPREEPLSY